MEDKIFDIITDLLREDITKAEAIEKLLVLYNVVGRSEQLSNSNLEKAIAIAKPNIDKINDVDDWLDSIR